MSLNPTKWIAILALALGQVVSASLAWAEAVQLSPQERLGKAIFEDPELSVGRNQACAFCHTPDTGFTSPRSDINAAGAVVEGSVPGRFGNSKPPSISYVAQSPVLYHTYEDGDPLFIGGAFWNGRASGKTLGSPVADQAQMPFLDPNEMALPHAACVVKRVCQPANPAHYPVTLADMWGSEICRIAFPADLDAACAKPEAEIELDAQTSEKIDVAFGRIALSIAAYEASSEVNPFSSKFDLVRAGKARFTAQEKLGLELFEDKGKCADCHVLDPGPGGSPPLFTDFTYDNLGVPANPANPFYANKRSNPKSRDWVERGLAVFLESDPLYAAGAPAQLGKVKVPSLRNVDRRPSPEFVKAFMHNGYFKTLKGVVNFYNTRDTKPRCKTPNLTAAQAMAQHCWPGPEVTKNVNTDEMGDLKLNETEEDAIVAFMKTLNDGYQPSE